MIDWMSKSKFAKLNNKSVNEVQRMIDEGLLEATLTDGGGKWMIKVEKNEDMQTLFKVIEDLSLRVERLSNHLGIRNDTSEMKSERKW